MPRSPEEYADQGFSRRGPVVSVTPKRRSPPSPAPVVGGRTDSGSFSQLVGRALRPGGVHHGDDFLYYVRLPRWESVERERIRGT